MLKDVLDGLKLVAEAIENVRKIAAAVESGKDYLKAKHPDVRSDVRAMVEELRKNLYLVKQGSAVVTNFRFALDAGGSEPVRFNEYFIKSKADAQHLRDHIDDLRTHCSKIREHAERIAAGASATGFAKVFAVLGLNAPAQEAALGATLGTLADDDFAVANGAEQMVGCVETALKDVQNALGSDGLMHAENVPQAAALLAQFAAEFEAMEARAVGAIGEIREVVKALG